MAFSGPKSKRAKSLGEEKGLFLAFIGMLMTDCRPTEQFLAFQSKRTTVVSMCLEFTFTHRK